MTTLPLTEVKARLSEIADEVDRTHDRVHITRNGLDYVVLIAEEDLASLEATLELLADPAARSEVEAAQGEYANGQLTTEAQMHDLMEARRLRERDGN